MSRAIALALLLAAAGIYACGGNSPGLDTPVPADDSTCTVNPTAASGDGGVTAASEPPADTDLTDDDTPSVGPECATGQ